MDNIKLILLFCLLIQAIYSIRISRTDYFEQEFSLTQTDQTCSCTAKPSFTAWGAFCTANCNNQAGCTAYSVYCTWVASTPTSSNTTTCLNNCSSHGTCNNGVCTCNSGWQGTDCSSYVYSCPNNCSSHGTCNTSNGLCTCWSGYSGSDCSLTAQSCPNNCSNQGQCDSATGICTCNNYYFGNDCSILSIPCPSNCSNHGTCNSQTGICSCVSPYAGFDCSSQVSNSSNSSCACQVISGYEAWSASCSLGCNSSSICSQYSTFCQWTSSSSLSCPNNCSNHGTCNNILGTCTCQSGYTGSDCSQIACSNNCSGKGTCNNGVCNCSSDWAGSDCSIPVLSCPNNCSNNGVCDTSTGICACNVGWSGSNCSTQVVLSCPLNCSGHGVCNTSTGVCACATGWGSLDCSTQLKVCLNNCSNNGICNTNTGVCTCNQYYSGTDCSIYAIPCPNSCSSQGTCNNQTGICSCQSGFTGTDCSISTQVTQSNVTFQQSVYALTWTAWTTDDILALFKPACLGLVQQIYLAYAKPDLNNGIIWEDQSPNTTVFYQNIFQNSQVVYKFAIQNLNSAYGIQTLISIGGWTLTNSFNFLANTYTQAQILAWAQKVKNVVDSYGAQGIDIDFESTNQTIWYNVLVKNNIVGALRQVMPSPYKIIVTMPYGAAINMTSSQIASSFNPVIAFAWGAAAAVDLIQQNWNNIDSINLMTYGSDSNLDPTQAMNLARQSINSQLGINNAQNKLNLGGLIGNLSSCTTGWCNWQISSATQATQYVKNNTYDGLFWWPESGNFTTQTAFYQEAYNQLNGKQATSISLPGVC